MGLNKKAAILFPPDLYDQLASLAEQRQSSVGEFVREACRTQYSFSSRAERLALIDRTTALSLPVCTLEEMERESVPAVEPLP